MAKMTIIINRHTAHIHANFAGFDGLENLLFALECVEYFQHDEKNIAQRNHDKRYGFTRFFDRIGRLKKQPDYSTAMTANTLLKPQAKAFRALALGITLGLSAPAFADSLPDIQRLVQQGQHSQALEKIDGFLSSRPKDAQGRFLKGLILTELNRPTDAIAVFAKLSEDYPELPEPYNNLAVLYAQQKQFDKARTALEMAIRTHPSYAIAHENLGDVYAKLASQAYDKALQLEGSSATTQNKLALIRELITTTTKGNVKPVAPAPSTTPPVVMAAVAPAKSTANTSVVTTTPGASNTASAPGETASASANPEVSEINRAISDWAAAWSKKDMAAYFAAYSDSFKPAGGSSRKTWEQEREQRIAGRSGRISVTFDTPTITVNGDQATARFRQHYKGPGLQSSSSKTLTFERNGSRWLIKEEKAR